MLAALVAIVAVVATNGGIDLGGGDDDAADSSAQQPASGGDDAADPGEQRPDDDASAEDEGGRSDSDSDETERASSGETPAAEERRLPENPDDVRGTDPFALTRPVNLRRALAVLERERQPVEGVYDGLRIAPGRIDTTIVHPDDRRTNVQVRADLKVSFKSTHDFPTQADFRQSGLTGRMVEPTVPARLLRAIDGIRDGSAAHDVDYVVISRDIIDHRVDASAYMRIRTVRPRMFSKEPGQPLRVIG